MMIIIARLHQDEPQHQRGARRQREVSGGPHEQGGACEVMICVLLFRLLCIITYDYHY